MLRNFTLAVLILVTATLSNAGVEPDADAYVYVSDQPGACFIDPYASGPRTYSVYAYSGSYTDVTGVIFRVGGDLFGPTNVTSVSTPPGVSIVGGNIFAGISLAFSSRALVHDPVLVIELSGVANGGTYVSTDNVVMTHGGANDLLPGSTTSLQVYDCFGTSALWSAPDTVDVDVDKDVSFSFDAYVSTGSYPPNGDVDVVDAQSWVGGAFPQAINAGCGVCPWSYSHVVVPVHVPKGTSDGTLNEITLQVYTFGYVLDEKTVVLRAVSGVATEETTWGRVKTLYR